MLLHALVRLIALASVLGVPLGHAASPAERPKVAVFAMVLVDSSLEGEMAGADPDEADRLDLLDQDLMARLRADGRLDVLAAEGASNRGCSACALETAEELGADFALTGWVQKVSDLILNINLRVTAVETGRVVFQDSVDIRGNTRQSWLRGLRALVERGLLAAPG